MIVNGYEIKKGAYLKYAKLSVSDLRGAEGINSLETRR